VRRVAFLRLARDLAGNFVMSSPRDRSVSGLTLLRRRGFVVVREGAGVRVGNQLCTLVALRAKADRERRLQAVQASMRAGPRRPAATAEVVTAPAV
jgi:hypothetical protein